MGNRNNELSLRAFNKHETAGGEMQGSTVLCVILCIGSQPDTSVFFLWLGLS